MQYLEKIKKSENGVTVAILAVTIVVLIIILGISLSYGTGSLKQTTDRKTQGELEMVQQAVANKYMLLLTQKNDGKIPSTTITADVKKESDTERPDELIGTRLATTNFITTYGFTDVTPLVNYSSTTVPLTFERYYYSLDESDLKTLGIEKNNENDRNSIKRTFIVNYGTGEVFDTANKKYQKSGASVYKEGTSTKVSEDSYDFED